MDDATSVLTQATGLTPQQQLYLTWVVMGLSFLGKLYGAAVAGGGIRAIVLRVWYGQNIPKAIAEDYHAELNQKADAPVTPLT